MVMLIQPQRRRIWWGCPEIMRALHPLPPRSFEDFILTPMESGRRVQDDMVGGKFQAAATSMGEERVGPKP